VRTFAAESGPLVYYPGSHRRPAFDGFPGYPLENLRTASAATVHAYQQHTDTEALGFERRQFLARTGDVLFWHGMLIHGGDAISVPGITRKSYVLHYLPAGVDVWDQVTGPSNW
jgi:phytanoyl-CoA hydroxylase